LKAPELAEVLVLEEDYLSAIIKGVEPGLRVNGDSSVTLSVPQNSPWAILANSRGLHDAFLVGNHAHRAMSDHRDPAVQENDIVLCKILHCCFSEIFQAMVSPEPFEKWFVLQNCMNN